MSSDSFDRQTNLKGLREGASLTQPELSQRLGLGTRIINDWEAGRKTPRFDNAISIAKVLKVSLKTLARSMKLDVSDIPDDGYSLSQLKAICKELGIENIDDLPNDWRELRR